MYVCLNFFCVVLYINQRNSFLGITVIICGGGVVVTPWETFRFGVKMTIKTYTA
jgi:hypothetical protein